MNTAKNRGVEASPLDCMHALMGSATVRAAPSQRSLASSEPIENEVNMPAEDDKDASAPAGEAKTDEDLQPDPESQWEGLPNGLKDLMPTEPYLFIPEGAETDPQNYGFDRILTMFLHGTPLFVKDDKYHWNLWHSLKSSCVLAADFLLSNKDEEAVVMIFVTALLDECLARGFDLVHGWFMELVRQSKESHERNVEWSFNLELLFQKFTYFHHAVSNSRSRKAMHAFLKERLTEMNAPHWVRRLESMSEQDLSVASLHFITTCDAVPEEVITIRVESPWTRKDRPLEVYPDTTLQWLFNCSTTLTCKGCFGLLTGSKSRMRRGQCPCPCIQLTDTNTMFYLVNSREKTLRELGIGAGSRIRSGNFVKKQAPELINIETKPKGRSVRKRKGRRSKDRRKSSQVQASQKKEPSSEALKELHSKAMEPVLNELRPKLKIIKQQIEARSLQKDRPKERRSNTRGKGKENAPNTEKSIVSIMDFSDGGKAGRTAYPVLVGESTDLFKMAQLRPRKALRRITLDLHGCSRYKALGILRKSLAEWIDVAMKGEYPFVVAVDIICGGGNQVLSEVVSQFIRNSPHIANRPKSIK